LAVYDDFAAIQKAKGVTGQAVYQAADNPNDITVTHEFGSVEAAQAFAKSAELKKRDAGCWSGRGPNDLVHEQSLRHSQAV
jgi:hypothetical protein